MCDSFVSIIPGRKGQSVIFGKNSSREPNEAQALEYYPSQSFSTKKKVHCTYISIPQVRETNAILISRPFWMWGAEMGTNEHGVVIGNQPVFTKMPYKHSGGLTGMDIVRLALERSDSAEHALEMMISLLADYSQGGSCGYQNKKLSSHSSFIIADVNEAWILETAGDVWAAVKVKDDYALSNALTIGSEYDQAHPDLIETAKLHKLLKPGKEFNFAESFSERFHTRLSASRSRRKMTNDMLLHLAESGDINTAFDILRSHGEDPYNPANHMTPNSICLHAGNSITRNANTTASMVAHLRSDQDNLFWATATAAPCISVYKPVWMEGDVLPDLGPTPNGQFNSKSYWWYHERMHRAVLQNYSMADSFFPERDKLQSSFVKVAYRMKSKERFKYTCDTFKESRELTKQWWGVLKDQSNRNSTSFLFRKYWSKQNQAADLII